MIEVEEEEISLVSVSIPVDFTLASSGKDHVFRCPSNDSFCEENN